MYVKRINKSCMAFSSATDTLNYENIMRSVTIHIFAISHKFPLSTRNVTQKGDMYRLSSPAKKSEYQINFLVAAYQVTEYSKLPISSNNSNFVHFATSCALRIKLKINW